MTRKEKRAIKEYIMQAVPGIFVNREYIHNREEFFVALCYASVEFSNLLATQFDDMFDDEEEE